MNMNKHKKLYLKNYFGGKSFSSIQTIGNLVVVHLPLRHPVGFYFQLQNSITLLLNLYVVIE